MELNQLITPKTAPAEFVAMLGADHFTVYLPTELCVTTPQIVVPRTARVYGTDLYLLDDEIVSYDELWKRRGRDFRGITYERGTYLIEVWDDDGCDGHVNWRLCGWKLIDAAVLDSAENKLDVIRVNDSDFDVLEAEAMNRFKTSG